MEKNYQNKNIPKPIKSMKEIEKIAFTKFSNHFNSKSKHNNILELIMEVLIFNKDCHLVTVFKDYMIWDFIDEFLKRYYNREEGKDRIPRYAHFYRNYSKFFCRPTFRDFEINEIIQEHGEKRAELYYNQNFRSKKDKNNFADEGLFEDDDSESVHVSKSKIEKTIFNKTIKKSIEDTNLYSAKDNETFLLNVDKDLIDDQNLLTKNSTNQSILKIINDFNKKKLEKEINENSNDNIKIKEINNKKEENKNQENNNLNIKKEVSKKEEINVLNKKKDEENKKKDLLNKIKEDNYISNKKLEDNHILIKKKEDSNIISKKKQNNYIINKKKEDSHNFSNSKKEENKHETINKPLQLYKYNNHTNKKNSNLISCNSLLKKNNSINEKNNNEIKKKSTQNVNINKSTQNKSQMQIIENIKHMYIKSRNINTNMHFYTKNDTQFKNYDLLTNNGKKIINLIKTQNVENLLHNINKNEKESHSKNIYSIDNLLYIHNNKNNNNKNEKESHSKNIDSIDNLLYIHNNKNNNNNNKINSTTNIHFSKQIQNKSVTNNSSSNFLKNNLSKAKLKASFSKGRSYSNNNQKPISPQKGKLNKNEELVKITLTSLLMNNKGRNNNNLKQLKTYKVNLSSNKNNPINNNNSNNQFQEIISSKLNNRINNNEKINLNINSNLNQIFNTNNTLKISRNKGRNIDLIPNTLTHQFKSSSINDKKIVLNSISKSQNKNKNQGKMINNVSSSQLINMGKLKINKPIHLKQKSLYGSLNYKKKSGAISYKK